MENDCWWKGDFDKNSCHHLMSTGISCQNLFHLILRYSKHSLGCSARSQQHYFAWNTNSYSAAIRLSRRNHIDLGIFHQLPTLWECVWEMFHRSISGHMEETPKHQCLHETEETTKRLNVAHPGLKWQTRSITLNTQQSSTICMH